MLDSFVRDSSAGGTFLTTYLLAGWRHADYRDTKWVGTSHQSIAPGCIYHRFRWIEAQCHQKGLAVLKLGRDRVHGQHWLEIKRVGPRKR
jgi:hypothetical protein